MIDSLSDFNNFVKDKNYDVLFNKVSENIFAIKNEK